MMESKIIEGNKLIAEFMGLHFHKIGWVDQYHIDGNYECVDLRYHFDWNWLMPVVDKISYYRLVHPEETAKVCNCKIVINKDRLYELVVEFLTWYKNQPS